MKVLLLILAFAFYGLCATGWVGVALYFMARVDPSMLTHTRESVLIDIAMAVVGHIGIAAIHAIGAKRAKAQVK